MIRSTFWRVKLKPKILSSQWFSMVIKMKWGNQNHSAIEEKTTLMTTMSTSFRPVKNCQKWKPINKAFSSPNHFQNFQDNINENDHDLNENDPIGSNFDSNKDKEKTMSNRNTKTKAPTTVILGDSILKMYMEITFQRL